MMISEEECGNCNRYGSILIDEENGSRVCTRCGEVVESGYIEEDLSKNYFDMENTGHSQVRVEKTKEMESLENLCDRYGFSVEVGKLAGEILKKYLEISEKISLQMRRKKNAPNKEMFVAMIKLACDKLGKSRSLKEFSNLFGITGDRLKLKLNEIHTSIQNDHFKSLPKQSCVVKTPLNNITNGPLPSRGSSYVGSLLEKISFGCKVNTIIVESFAKQLCDNVSNLELIEGKPSTVAACCLAWCLELLGVKITLKNFSQSVGLSEATLKKKMADLRQNSTRITSVEKINEAKSFL